jgi:hypothetical protein
MLCRNCGKELRDGWVNCPYCGAGISGNENTELKMPGKNVLDSKGQMDEAAAIQERLPLHTHEKMEYRDFWKYIILSFATCGIYAIYTWYGYVKDINRICEGDGQESKSFIIVLLLTSVTGGIYGIYWWYIQGERLYRAASKYGIKLRENGKSILLWLIPANIIMLGGGTLVANYIMFDNMNLIAKMYNGDMSEEELQKAGKPHPNLIQNVWAVYGILLVVGVISIVAAMRSDSFEGANAQSEERLENTVNEQSGASDIYDDSAENDYSYGSADETQLESIYGTVIDISDNAMMIEDIYPGKNTWITIDSYSFSHEYHQCSNRNDLEDLENAGIGDSVFLVRTLDKTHDTVALCFEIVDAYSDIQEENEEMTAITPEPTTLPSTDYQVIGAYISTDSTLMMDITSPYNNGIYEVSVFSTGGNYGNDYYDFSGELDAASGTISYSNCTHIYKSNQAGQGSTIMGENLSGTLTHIPGTQSGWTWNNPSGPDTSATFDYFFNPAM